jgi:hypothetical protein
MALPTFKGSFSSGEVSPSLYGHLELQRWHTSASVARNFFVDYKGGLLSRSGTAIVGISKQPASETSLPPRLIEFSFSVTQSYVLEVGDHYMRFVANGGYILEPSQTITAATNASPAVLTIPSHNYANGDWVFVDGIVGMTELNGRTFIVQDVTTNTFSLQDELGFAINSTGFVPYVSGGTAARLYTLVTPWAAEDLPYLKYTQSADVMSICCVNQQTRVEYPPQELTRLAADNWTISPPVFASAILAPASCTATANQTWNSGATAPNPGPAAYGYVVTAIDINGNESVASPIGQCANSVDISGQFGTVTVTWAGVPGAQSYNIYRATPDFTNIGDFAGQLFGYVGTSRTTKWQDTNIISDFAVTPPLHTDPFARGAIVGVTMATTGTSYTSATTVSITSTTGTGFVGIPVIDTGGNGVTYQILSFAAPPPFNLGDSLSQPPGDATGTVVGIGVNSVTVAPTKIGHFHSTFFVANRVVNDTTNSTSATPNTVTSTAAGTLGAITDVFVENGGTGYQAGDTLVFNDPGGGGGAAGTITVGPQSGTYPGVVEYFQQRRVYAATLNQPDTYFMSQPGRFLDFDGADPPIDSDAVIGSPWAKQINGIQWLLPMPGGLIAATGKDAWQIAGTGGPYSPVTPAQQQAQQQETVGYSPFLHPLKIGFSILFGQSLGTAIRETNYNFYYNIYTGKDVTVLSSHLFQNLSLKEWCWAQEPYKVVWGVRTDGKLLGLTYIKEEEVAGWTRHDTNGLFVSIASASEPPVNAVYVIVKRYIAGKGRWAYMQERMDNRLWTNIEEAWCVDSALALPQTQRDAFMVADRAAPTLAALPGPVILGGSNYTNPSGRIVDATGTGAVVDSVTVSGGAITAFTISPGGANYSNPRVVFSDATGSGAVAEVLLDQSVNFFLPSTDTDEPDADTDEFLPDDVGSVVRCGGGVAVVTEFIAWNSVNARFVSGINPNTTPVTAAAAITATMTDDPNNRPLPFLNWTITKPVRTVFGLGHLEGMTVTGLADGRVIPPTIVANGSITLTDPASAIVIGLPFIAQAQSMHAELQGDQIQGKRKRITAVTVRLANSRGVKVGQDQPIAATLQNQAEVPWNRPPALMAPLDDITNSPDSGVAAPLFTGDKYMPVVGDYQTMDNQASPGMVAVLQETPLPVEILAFVPLLEVGDTN